MLRDEDWPYRVAEYLKMLLVTVVVIAVAIVLVVVVVVVVAMELRGRIAACSWGLLTVVGQVSLLLPLRVLVATEIAAAAAAVDGKESAQCSVAVVAH